MQGNGSLIVEIRHQEKGIQMRFRWRIYGTQVPLPSPNHGRCCSLTAAEPSLCNALGSHNQSLVVGTQVHLIHLLVLAR